MVKHVCGIFNLSVVKTLLGVNLCIALKMAVNLKCKSIERNHSKNWDSGEESNLVVWSVLSCNLVVLVCVFKL